MLLEMASRGRLQVRKVMQLRQAMEMLGLWQDMRAMRRNSGVKLRVVSALGLRALGRNLIAIGSRHSFSRLANLR